MPQHPCLLAANVGHAVAPRRPWVAALLAAAAWLAAGGAPAANYYFSSAGNDVAGNGSQASPWKSIAKFNALDLNAGDNVYFRAGDSFSGTLYLNEADNGTNVYGKLIAPISIGSYGATAAAPRAKIVSPAGAESVFAYNTGGLEFRNLELISGGMLGTQRADGLRILSDRAKNGSLNNFEHLRIDNVVSRGFGLNGLRVWSHVNVGYKDVQITNSEFFDNGYSGIYVGGQQWNSITHANVVIDGVASHHNMGFYDPVSTYTGHGILLGQTAGGAIQNSVAHENGLAFGRGNIGIWMFRSDQILIQNNVSYGNRSPAGADGGGFDIDGGATNSIVQFNRSYDNEGAGLLLAEFYGSVPMKNNLFRYNLSVNDGQGGLGAITVYGNNAEDLAQDAVFHNNTIIVDQAIVPNSAGAVQFDGYHDDILFANNVFVALNGAPLISGTTSGSTSSFLGNAYWTDGGPLDFQGTRYQSLQHWSNATSQERIGNTFVGISADPQLLEDGSYRPDFNSPLIDAGRLPGGTYWPTWLASLGGQDLNGVALYQGLKPDVGAYEVLHADFNGDGLVNAGDHAIWSQAFNSSGATARMADLNGDGVTDGAELLQWQRRLGTNAQALPGLAQVPEAATLLLLLQVVGVVACRRRSAA